MTEAKWQVAKNESEFLGWDDAPDEIKAILQNDDLTVNFGARVPFGDYVYNATEYKGKVRVFRQKPKGNQSKRDESIINTDTIKPELTDNPAPVQQTSTEQPQSDREFAVSSGGELIVKTQKVVDFVPVKPAEVKAKLAEGFELFGANFNEAYRDGLVGMVKYQLVPVRVA